MRYSRLPLTTVLLGLLVFTGCLRKKDYVPVNRESLKTKGKLYLIPIEDFPIDVANKLASFYRDNYRLESEVLSSVTLTPAAMNQQRSQLIAEEAIEIMKLAKPDQIKDPEAILIGLTNRDMYIAQMDWEYSFSWRDEGKYAVVSSGRMHMPNGRQKVTEELILTRMRKMVTKNVGILCYHLQQSTDPRSVLYRDVGGIRELDYMGEEF